jgi:TatD DNase family protein
MFVDSHCHLSFPELLERVDEIRSDMAVAKVDRALCICTTLEEFDQVHSLATQFDNFWCSAGVHPDNEGVREPTLHDLVSLAHLPRVVAIGETGLDYYRLNGRSIADMEWQRERFRLHIRASRATSLPLVIHTRSASDDTLAILREEGAQVGSSRDLASSDVPSSDAVSSDTPGGVFHCFTETDAVARAALDLGFYISFSGIITFKTAQALRDVAAFVPLDRCLIETDSPYLAPVPYRGKTNSPAYVPFVAKLIAEIKGLSIEEVARATSANFERLFRVPAIQNQLGKS